MDDRIPTGDLILRGPDNRWLVVCSAMTNQLEGPFTEATLIARIRELHGQKVSVFPFVGVPYYVSSGPLRHLLTPSGVTFPLSADPADLSPDPTGNLFDASNEPTETDRLKTAGVYDV